MAHRQLRPFLALVVACSAGVEQLPIETTGGSGGPSSSWGTTGGASENSGDAGGCAPSLSSFVPAYHPPSIARSACTSAQIVGFYQSCSYANFNGAACAAWAAADAECDACLGETSAPTDASWGPFVGYRASNALNFGGCVALTQEFAGLCAQALENAQECEHKACDSECNRLPDESTCIAQVKIGACSAQEQTEDVQCAGLSSACATPDDSEGAFVAVASAFCL